jgi:hypothetical protein
MSGEGGWAVLIPVALHPPGKVGVAAPGSRTHPVVGGVATSAAAATPAEASAGSTRVSVIAEIKR